jgi:hypothetical protein
MKNNKKRHYIGAAAACTLLAGILILPLDGIAAPKGGSEKGGGGKKGGGAGGSSTFIPNSGYFTCRASALYLDSLLVPTLSPVLSLLSGADGDNPIDGNVFEPVIANPLETPCATDGDVLLDVAVPGLASLGVLVANTENDVVAPIYSDAFSASLNLANLVSVGVLESSAAVKSQNGQCALSGNSSVAALSIATSKVLSLTTGLLGIITGSEFQTTTSTISLLTAPTDIEVKVGLDLSLLGLLKIDPLVVARVALNQQYPESARLVQRALEIEVNVGNVQILLDKLNILKDTLKGKIKLDVLGINLSLDLKTGLLSNITSLINDLTELLDYNELVVSEAIVDFEGGNPCLNDPNNPEPPTQANKKRMTGGGSIGNTGVRHGFTLHCDASRVPNNLEINWGNGNRFHLDTLNTATCSDTIGISEGNPVAGFDTFTGTGTGSYNGSPGHSISFTFTDAGEPGTSDKAKIAIDGGAVLNINSLTALKNGNHQAHP